MDSRAHRLDAGKPSLHLLIVGRGKMAQLIRNECVRSGVSYEILPDGPQKGTRIEPNVTVLVHVGSGRVFLDALDWCEVNFIPLIQASSSMKDDAGNNITIPTGVRTQVVSAPNLALGILALFRILPQFGRDIQSLGGVVSVTESHQSSKTSAPITAQKVAGHFGLPPGAVISIRDQKAQQDEFGVPREFLDGHAYHIIDIVVGEVIMSISVKIHGRNPYFAGLMVVAERLVADGVQLPPAVYECDEYLFGERANVIH